MDEDESLSFWSSLKISISLRSLMIKREQQRKRWKGKWEGWRSRKKTNGKVKLEGKTWPGKNIKKTLIQGDSFLASTFFSSRVKKCLKFTFALLSQKQLKSYSLTFFALLIDEQWHCETLVSLSPRFLCYGGFRPAHTHFNMADAMQLHNSGVFSTCEMVHYVCSLDIYLGLDYILHDDLYTFCVPKLLFA